VEINSKISIKTFEEVYEPADDSYMLIEAIEVNEGEKALDMGCGTGIVAIYLAKAGCDATAADIKEKALENTRENAERNGVKIRIVKSDLFSNIDGKFDIIVFNPPYLPTRNEDIAWDGGKEGIDVIVPFLENAKTYLNREGSIYLVMSSLSNIDKIVRKFSKTYRFSKVAEKRLFFERLFVYRLQHIQLTDILI